MNLQQALGLPLKHGDSITHCQLYCFQIQLSTSTSRLTPTEPLRQTHEFIEHRVNTSEVAANCLERQQHLYEYRIGFTS